MRRSFRAFRYPMSQVLPLSSRAPQLLQLSEGILLSQFTPFSAPCYFCPLLGRWLGQFVSTSRAQASKYIAYIFFGFANVLAIAAARQWLGPEGIVASRYAVAGMPIVIGTCGILALMSANHFHGLFAFVALLPLSFHPC